MEQLKRFQSIYDQSVNPRNALFFDASFDVCHVRRMICAKIEQSLGQHHQYYAADKELIVAAVKLFSKATAEKLRIPEPDLRVLSTLKHVMHASLAQDNISNPENQMPMVDIDLDQCINDSQHITHEKKTASEDIAVSLLRKIGFSTDALLHSSVSPKALNTMYLLPEERQALLLYFYKRFFELKPSMN